MPLGAFAVTKFDEILLITRHVFVITYTVTVMTFLKICWPYVCLY